MHVAEAIVSRKSIRAFKSDSVLRATIEEILTLAARAPSGGNLQPWRVYALLGEARNELVRRVAEARSPNADGRAARISCLSAEPSRALAHAPL